jgi:hypothetical protein
MRFFEECLNFTINGFLEYQKRDKRHNRWAYSIFNTTFFQILANTLLRFPEETHMQKFLDPISLNWEEAPSIMETFLRSLSFPNVQQDLEDTYFDLWLWAGNKVLSSRLIRTMSYPVQNDHRNILDLLLKGLPDFSDSSRMVKWSLENWRTSNKLTNFIKEWCDIAGHQPDCFPSLIRFLKTCGFILMVDHGISWLCTIIKNVDDHKLFFERSAAVGIFTDLLYDIWLTFGKSFKDDPMTFRYFNYLVDKAAEQGQRTAIQLQQRLQDSVTR